MVTILLRKRIKVTDLLLTVKNDEEGVSLSVMNFWRAPYEPTSGRGQEDYAAAAEGQATERMRHLYSKLSSLLF